MQRIADFAQFVTCRFRITALQRLSFPVSAWECVFLGLCPGSRGTTAHIFGPSGPSIVRDLFGRAANRRGSKAAP